MDDKKYEKLLEEHKKITKEILEEEKIKKEFIETKIKNFKDKQKEKNEIIKEKELSEKIKIEIEKKWFYISKFENYFKDVNYFNKETLFFGIFIYISLIIIFIFFWKIVWSLIFFLFLIFCYFSLITKSIIKEINLTNSFLISILSFILLFFINPFIQAIFYYKLQLDYNFGLILSSFLCLIIISKSFNINDSLNYILISKDKVFIWRDIYEIKNWEIFSNENIYKFFKEKKIKFIKKHTDNKITFLKLTIIDLENFSKKINEKKENISKNLEIFDFYKFKNEIIFLEKYINKSLKIKEKIKNDLLIKKYFPKEKFENYLKENLVFPLKELKNILQNNLEKIENLQNKNSENPQIILANKRLEIQKNSLQKQILLLDEKIKKLEN